MGDIMRQIPFTQLMQRTIAEYREHSSIFSIPASQFFRKIGGPTVTMLDQRCDTALGPAAGPHTQLAQNIITAYLAGGRFLELKTVQKLDTLEIEKPCIDAGDEGYNTEWSSEYTLVQAYEEYVKAWFAIHVLEELFGFSSTGKRSFVFNMSIGYDLAGIKLPKMQNFIGGMTDASEQPFFQRCRKELEALTADKDFLRDTDLEGKELSGLADRISPKISNSVALSTMHGCPPKEIEAICHYLLTEKKLNTFVKLNPTLLGYETANGILKKLGYEYVELSEASFSQDLQANDALDMLKRLLDSAQQEQLEFGVKLTNTLGAKNTLGRLPGDEFYMSGRALFPLTIHVAAMLSEAFDGQLHISYSGGVSQLNVQELFELGIRPITMATDLLKPGGYLRMKEMALLLESAEGPRNGKIDVTGLKQLASNALTSDIYRKDWRGTDKVAIGKALPLFDCYAAPCVVACPIHQDVPEYIRLIGEERYDEALELIYAKNALPHITGYICDHQCMFKCTRLDYEGSVRIRDMKLLTTEQGWEKYLARYQAERHGNGIKTAVLGAGAAGLSAAYFLRLAGFEVTVFEKEQSAGGVVQNVLPSFRLPAEAIEQDVEFIKAHGVEFRFGASETFSIADIQAQGFQYIFIGVGAELSGELQLNGDAAEVRHSLEFLREFKQVPEEISLGKSVAVIGGGNTAMDSARAALQIPGVEKVSIVYRRTEAEMPADREEFELALADDVKFLPLLSPEAFSKAEGMLICRKMTLGEPDESGRRRPVPSDELMTLPANAVIAAIGEKVNIKLLQDGGLKSGEDGWIELNKDTLETSVAGVYIGGDAFRGPSTVVESLADGKRAAESIAAKALADWSGFDEKNELKSPDRATQYSEILQKKAQFLSGSADKHDTIMGPVEARRCLECNTICNKCVDVCPNRANMAIEVERSLFKDAWQILHLDAFCNECGNCSTFCPYEGDPYKDKLTLFALPEDFENSRNSGFLLNAGANSTQGSLRLDGTLYDFTLEAESRKPEFENSERIEAALLKRIQATIQAVCRDYNYIIQ
ncbi:MAG: putative selenate reductase subunit YgfK [bacterium]|nr:putative selenate reductase subunit YgfK [bacterium]